MDPAELARLCAIAHGTNPLSRPQSIITDADSVTAAVHAANSGCELDRMSLVETSLILGRHESALCRAHGVPDQALARVRARDWAHDGRVDVSPFSKFPLLFHNLSSLKVDHQVPDCDRSKVYRPAPRYLL